VVNRETRRSPIYAKKQEIADGSFAENLWNLVVICMTFVGVCVEDEVFRVYRGLNGQKDTTSVKVLDKLQESVWMPKRCQHPSLKESCNTVHIDGHL
jgi:hypothetical protein